MSAAEPDLPLVGPDSGLQLSVCLVIAAGVLWALQVARGKGQSWNKPQKERLKVSHPIIPTLGLGKYWWVRWSAVPQRGKVRDAEPAGATQEAWPGCG